MMKHSMLDDAYAISKHLARHLWKHSGKNRYGRGQTRIKVLCHESADELREYGVGQYQLNSLPSAWSVYLPRSLKNAFASPRMPVWEPEEIWDLLHSFRWVCTMTGGCPTRSLFETVHFPSFLMHHYGSTRNPVEWHAYLRQKAVFIWAGSPWSVYMERLAPRESRWLGVDGERRQREPTELLFSNLHRHMIPSSKLLYARLVKECKSNCANCTMYQCLAEEGMVECGDAFEVQAADCESMTAMNATFERQLREMMSGWPVQFALEQQALFLNITDMQTEFLLHEHRKQRSEIDEAAKQMLQDWIAIKGRCDRDMETFALVAYPEAVWQQLQLLGLAPKSASAEAVGQGYSVERCRLATWRFATGRS